MKNVTTRKPGIISTETIGYTFTAIIVLMLLNAGVWTIIKIFNAANAINNSAKQSNTSYEKLN